MATLVTIWKAHRRESKSSIEDAVRDYALNLRTMGSGAVVIAEADLKEFEEYLKVMPDNDFLSPLPSIASLQKALDNLRLRPGETARERRAREARQFYDMAKREIEKFKKLWGRAPSAAEKQPGKRGRPSRAMKELMRDDADGAKLARLHELMKDKAGKAAYLIIVAAVIEGWTDAPSYAQVTAEFGHIGSRQGFNRYMNKGMFKPEEIEGARNSLVY